MLTAPLPKHLHDSVVHSITKHEPARRSCSQQHTCPPLDISLVRARCTISSVPFMMYVVTFWRPEGGLKMVLRSRIPVRDMWRVRGIGVAVSVSTSTPVVKTFSFFFKNPILSGFELRTTVWPRRETFVEAFEGSCYPMLVYPMLEPRSLGFPTECREHRYVSSYLSTRLRTFTRP